MSIYRELDPLSVQRTQLFFKGKRKYSEGKHTQISFLNTNTLKLK